MSPPPATGRRWPFDAPDRAPDRADGIIGPMTGPLPADATATLRARDEVLAALIDRHGPPPRRRPVRASQRFGDLAQIVVHQQLAGRAAASIHGRLVDALGGTVTPEAVLAAPPEALAGSGLSGAKAASIRDLAEQVVAGRILLERIGRLDDDAVVEHLTQVRGIGPWTAHMFLIGTLGRLDVWPVGDFGVRAGFATAWSLDHVPTPKQLLELGEPFRPFRSLVAWYCWRVVDDKSVLT
jgi:3-methyladenine DNA glycosylase/8-oxoguanine DNA glycosylase